ncbi:hypothetical protein KGM_215112A, partial [Danaus plexippus plexippus]
MRKWHTPNMSLACRDRVTDLFL